MIIYALFGLRRDRYTLSALHEQAEGAFSTMNWQFGMKMPLKF